MAIHTYVYPPTPPSTLPAGSATAANQVLEIAQLTGIHSDTTSIDSKTPTLGQKTMAGSSPVVIASDQSPVPVSQSGTWNINNISGTVSLPTGAATAANQAAQIDSSVNIELDVDQIRIDTTAIRTEVEGIHTDTSAIALSTASIDGNVSTIATNTPPLGQADMANSSPVVIASDQSPIPITGTVTASNPSVSTTGTAVPASATMVGGSDGTNLRAVKVSATGVLSVDGSAVTQPVSAASLPLPTGAATSANQTTANASLSSIDSKLTSPITVTGPLTDTQLRATAVPVSASQTGTWNINNISGTVSLPTGAATSAKQPALGTAGTPSADVITVQGITSMTALKVDGSAVTQPVSLTSVPATTGRTPVTFIRNDYSSVNVTTAAYVQLVASTGSTINKIEIFDSSGQTLKIAFGAAASEVDKFLVFPGGNGPIDINIPASTRVSIRAVSADATVGEIDVNFYS